MKKPTISFKLLFFFIFTIIIVLNSKIKSTSDDKSANYSPPVEIKYFLFGYNEVFADTLWLRIIQNPDLCEVHHIPKGGPRTGINRIADCTKSWVYHMLDTTVEVAPRFHAPAQYGPMFLSVLVDDIEGATLLFEKVLPLYPTDWQLYFQAGTHHLRETGDFQKAAKYYEVAAKNGAPKWVYALSANLYKKSGQAMAGKILIEQFLKDAPDDFYGRSRLETRLKEINEELAKAEE